MPDHVAELVLDQGEPLRSAETDEELVARYQSTRSNDALNELVRRHLRAVRGTIYPMVLDHSRADDLTQDVFLRVIRGLNDFRSESKFSTWLYRIAWNVLQSDIARNQVVVTGLESEWVHESPNDHPDRIVLRDELHQQVESGLASLSPKLRAAIVLTVLQQLTPDEAAALEGCSTATMYWRIHEARRQLQARLASYLR